MEEKAPTTLLRPVESVSWDDIQEYLRKAGYRLPTEAEWELAAGDCDEIPTLDQAWCKENASMTTHPVGLLRPNCYGLYDMLGNVWEWTSTSRLGSRFLRGGSWYYYPYCLRASYRNYLIPSYPYYNYGFRCAQDYKGQDIPDGWSLIPGSDEIPSFLMKQHQTTQKEWIEIMGYNPSYFKE